MHFDIGAYDGGKAQEVYDFIDKDIVCCEPNPYSFEKLQHRFNDKPSVRVLNVAVDEEVGNVVLNVSRRHAPISSIEKKWVEKSRFAGNADENGVPYTWDERVEVQSVNLDWLVENYGIPSTIKVDVEGAEYAVIKGLSKFMPECEISLEFNEEFLVDSIACMEWLHDLGWNRFGLIDGDEIRRKPNKYHTWEDFMERVNIGFPTKTGDFFGTVYVKYAKNSDS